MPPKPPYLNLTELSHEDKDRLIDALFARLNAVEAKRGMDSENSSKPPSSDVLAKKTTSLRESSGKPAGGQKGRKGTTLRQAEQPDDAVPSIAEPVQPMPGALAGRRCSSIGAPAGVGRTGGRVQCGRASGAGGNLQLRPIPYASLSRRRDRRSAMATNLLCRFRLHADAVLRFIGDFDVPLNNTAERAVRMPKVKQKISGCCRTLDGAEHFCVICSSTRCANKATTCSPCYSARSPAILSSLLHNC